MEMPLHRTSWYTLVVALLVAPTAAGAQAFGLNEIGSCALSRAFAATAAPCDDASSIYWNPGALPKTAGFSVYGGAAIISIDGDFTRDTSFTTFEGTAPTAVVPHVFLDYRAGRLAYGVGVYVPYGLTSQWADSFPGRFSALKASLKTLYVQPNIAFQLTDNWSVGGGPVFGHSTVELIQAVDFSQQVAAVVGTPPDTMSIRFGQFGIPLRTEFARAQLKGSANAFGFALGIHGQPTPEWQVGARFLSRLTFNYDDADATFTQTPTGLVLTQQNPLMRPAGTRIDDLVAAQFTTGGALVPQKVTTRIRHPAQFQAGLSYAGLPRTLVSLDYAWVGWRSFKNLPIDFQGGAPDRTIVESYNNTSSFRLGVERMMNRFALRGGFAAAASAAPDETVTPLLPEQDRGYWTLGVGVPLMGTFGLDAGYAHVFTSGRRGRIDERGSTTTSAQAIALNSGVYSLSANIFSLSLKASF
jgi:long-chain fatty acid transport protein